MKVCVIPEGQTRCEKCKKCLSPAEIQEHVCETFICNLCGKVLYSKESLRNHQKYHHQVHEEVPCELCGKDIQKAHMKRHLRIHREEKDECPQCGVKVRNLYNHLKNIHTSDKDKKYQCQDCGKGLVTMIEQTERLMRGKLTVDYLLLLRRKR